MSGKSQRKVESIINEIGRDDITAVPAKYLNNELILIDLDFVRLCYKFKPFVKIMSKSNFYAKYKSKKYYNYDLMIDIPLTLKIFNNQNFASLKLNRGNLDMATNYIPGMLEVGRTWKSRS